MGLYDFAVLDHLLAGLFNRSKMLLWKKRFAVFSTPKAVSNSGLVDVSCMKYSVFLPISVFQGGTNIPNSISFFKNVEHATLQTI